MHFLDTNILVGAADRQDELHEIGKRVLTQVATGRHGASVLSDFVLDETLTILGRRRGIGPKTATTVVQAFLTSPRIRCVFVDQELLDDALVVFQRFGTSLSFTDSTSVAIMRAVGCDTLYSNDSGFDRVPGIVRRTETG